jgi:hypothetical protein
MTNWDRLSVRISSASVGRCEISMVFLLLLLGTRYLMPVRPAAAVAAAENCAYFE